MTNKELLEEAMEIIATYGDDTSASDFAKEVIRFLHELQTKPDQKIPETSSKVA